MPLLSILVCFSALLQASLSTQILDSKCSPTSGMSIANLNVDKPKPVDLSFTCTTVSDANQDDFKHDDVPVILLHGSGGKKELWHGVFEVIALDTKKKVCVVDLRNHGESPWNDEEYDVIAMTEDIRHFMDHINAPKAIVLGHSLGGRIAVHLALSYPERVEKVIVEDMRPNGVTPEVLDRIQQYSRFFKEMVKVIPQGMSEKEALEKLSEHIKEYFVKLNVTVEAKEVTMIPIKCSDGKCQLNVNPVTVEALARNTTEMLNESSGIFNGPALFIYGAQSPFKVGEDESNIKKLFPEAELVAVEGADHMVHHHKKFLTEVIKFINS